MKFWSLAEEPKHERGFAAAMKDLISRKEREFADRWSNLPERQRNKKIRDKAFTEMARRIKQHSGKLPAVSTLARKYRANEMPAGTDDQWLTRWSQIDRAGSIEKLAARFGWSRNRVTRWRDEKPGKTKRRKKKTDTDVVKDAERRRGKKKPADEEPEAEPLESDERSHEPGPDQLELGFDVDEEFEEEEDYTARVGFETWGYLMCDGKTYRKHMPASYRDDFAWVTVDREDELRLYDAYEIGDIDTINEIISPLISEQIFSKWEYETNLPPGSSYTIDEVIDMHFPGAE